MAKIKEIRQQNFWSGITNEPRSTLVSSFWYSENLDVGKGKSLKQVVNNQAENACSYNVNNYITRVIQNGTDIYGLGQDNNTNHYTTIWKKSNALDGVWATALDGTTLATTFAGEDSLFSCVNGMIYFNTGGTDVIGKYNISTSVMIPDWKTVAGGLKGGTIWQGNIYGWIGQSIYKIDPVAETATEMKTVSSEQTIVDLAPYGNLLAVICTSTVTNSKMYLWDGVSTTVWVEIIDIGYGTVVGGANLEGMIITVIGSANKKNIKIKGYNGGSFRNLFTYNARQNRAGTYKYIQPASKVKAFSGYIYFIITGTKPDGTYANYYEYSIARFGREEPVNPMTFSIYKTLDFSSARGLDGQIINNDFTIIENIVGASDIAEKSVLAFIYSDTNKTTEFISSTNTYTGQAGVLETVRYNGGDGSITKQLKGIATYFSALGSSGQVVLKYKKDEELVWTNVLTYASGSAVVYAIVNNETDGINLPQFNELQLRYELTGDVELTGYNIKYEELMQNY